MAKHTASAPSPIFDVETTVDRPKRVGMFGGGQLARLSVPAAKALGIELCVLDAKADAPAGRAGATVIEGRLDDHAALQALVKRCDVTTFETEAVAVEALMAMAEQGHHIVPAPHLMQQLTNKLAQKRLLLSLNLPTTAFVEVASPSRATLLAFGLPAVLKRQHGGYDGRGVNIVRTERDLDDLWPEPSVLETYVNDVVELAVLVARREDDEVCVYPVTEMVFAANHALDYLIAPANQPPDVIAAATTLALRTVRAMDGVGLFAIEMFLTPDGMLLINEIAPRAHNSGHYTIEACATSQFEQHLRAVTGLALGSAELLRPAAMINLVGSPGFRGASVVEGWNGEALPDVAVHIYEKSECWPGRKMGHITALGESTALALQTARAAASGIRVRGSTAT